MNSSGQLGNGTTTDSNVPVAVVSGLQFASINAGANHTCGVTKSGQALCWGRGDIGELGNGSGASSPVPVTVEGGHAFISVSAGNAFTCGVTKQLGGLCWGVNNNYGQLGDGTLTDRWVPTAVAGSFQFTSIHAGAYHGCGIVKQLGTYCWGDNLSGQVGNGTNVNVAGPVPVALLD
jgi:alpha-tubulin suppressor-like RCC1 family protein